MPVHISEELSAAMARWFALAAVQLLICAIFYGGSDDGSAWVFAEPPLIVLGAAMLRQTGAYWLALAMLAYLVLALALGLAAAAFLILAGNGRPEAVAAALDPRLSLRLVAELLVLPGAWRALGAARALRRLRLRIAAA